MTEQKQESIKEAVIRIAECNGVKTYLEGGYVLKPEDNLIDGKHTHFDEEWEKAKDELLNGAGNELKRDEGSGKPKFCAAHSSSALAVNNFLPWKRESILKNIKFHGKSGFTEATFEKKQSTGISTPHLDLFLENEDTIFAFESKFMEPLSPTKKEKDEKTEKKHFFKPRYFDLDYLPQDWHDLMKEYENMSDETALYFNAPQIIKHAIGLINQNREKNRNGKPKKNITLFYLYWVPENVGDYLADKANPYAVHRDELSKFMERFKGNGQVSFVPLTYLELWDKFDEMFKAEEFLLLRRYYEKVKARYRFAVPCK